MGSELEASAARQSQAMSGVGPAWIGNGAVSAQAAVNQLGASSRKVATSANNAAVVLKTCAGRWEQAKARWAQAQNLAAQAMAEEAAQRNQVTQQASAGNPIAGIDQALGLAYQSPLRSQATAMGQAAINDFNAATASAKGGLAGAAAPITPPAPKPVHHGGLLNDLEGVAKASVRDLQTAGNWAVGFLGDPNNQKVFQDGTAMTLGLGMILLGAGGEVGGSLFDGTIVLSPAGVAANVASAGVIAGGAGMAGVGAWHMGSDIPNMNFAKNYDGLGGKPDQSVPTPQGGDPYDPQLGGQVKGYGGYKTNGVVHLDGDPTEQASTLQSGKPGPFQDLPPAPRPGTGYNGTVLTHVEAHATALMRTKGVQRATLYINRLPVLAGPGALRCSRDSFPRDRR